MPEIETGVPPPNGPFSTNFTGSGFYGAARLGMQYGSWGWRESAVLAREVKYQAELQRGLLHHPRPRSDHPDIVDNKPLVGLNCWPPDMPEFRAATTAYCGAMEAMTTRLVPIVAMTLDLPPDYFAEAFAQPNCTIQLVHYPPHRDPKGNEFASAPRTDNNFLTFLAHSVLSGLEVRTAEGEWIRCRPCP